MIRVIYRIKKLSRRSQARIGRLTTAHGVVPTPAFMPIATRGSVKTLSGADLRIIGADIILANTYHLLLQPGLPVLRKFGGLHKFMDWSGPILTDSGGFQVFSLSRHRQITGTGVDLKDPVNGNKYRLTPASVLKIQSTIGSDIRMVLDECVGYPSSEATAQDAVARTTKWAKRSIGPASSSKNLTFGIVQGSVYPELRRRSLAEITALDFDGFALGGLAVGEPESDMFRIIEEFASQLPSDRPRYIMGYGRPEQIVAAVRAGADMFDCVLPSRNARHGYLYVWSQPKPRLTNKFYSIVRIQQSSYRADARPIDPHCTCPTCQTYSRAYVRHMFNIGDPLGLRLATIHNVNFYLELMRRIRQAIEMEQI